MLVSFLISTLLLTTLAAIVGCGGGPKETPPRRAETSKSIGPSLAQSKKKIEPKKGELNEKEALIQKGLKTSKNAYPTLEDIKSDWSDKDEKKKEEEEPRKEEKNSESRERIAERIKKKEKSDDDEKRTSNEHEKRIKKDIPSKI